MRVSPLTKSIFVFLAGSLALVSFVVLAFWVAKDQVAADTFDTPATYSVGDTPYSITSADFNGDTYPDFATSNHVGNTVSIYLGNGDGTFTAAVPGTVGVGLSPRWITSRDLNADNHIDLVVANMSGGTISILLGNGDGTFAAAADYSVGNSPFSVESAYLNPDGSPDLVVANYGSNSVSILINSGTGTFVALAPDVPVGNNPNSVAVGDFNGDAKTDLAVSNFLDNTVSILLGNGDGTFIASTPSTVNVGVIPTDVITEDLNHDSNLDLVVANRNDDTLSVLLGNGDGTFAAQVSYATGSTPYQVIASDIDSDGNFDLLNANNTGSNFISVLLGSGDGTFQPATFYTSSGNNPGALVANDFNLDGRKDIAVANLLGSSVSVFLRIPFGPLHHFSVDAIPSQVAGDAFDIVVTAKDSVGNTVTDFSGKVDISMAFGSVIPYVSDVFTAGVLTQSITLSPDAIGPSQSVSVADHALSGAGGQSADFTVADQAVVTSVTSSLADGTYPAGQTIPIQVVFSTAVNVSGIPQLSLATGQPASTLVNYISGTGTDTLVFQYVPISSNAASDLDYVDASALTVNGGSITYSGSHVPVLTLPVPGAAGSLGANKNIIVSTPAPSGGGVSFISPPPPPPPAPTPDPIPVPDPIITPKPEPAPEPEPKPEPIPDAKPDPKIAPDPIADIAPGGEPTSGSSSDGGNIASSGGSSGGIATLDSTQNPAPNTTFVETLGCADKKATTTYGVLSQETESSYCQTVLAVHTSAKQVQKILESPSGTVVTNTIATVGVVGGATVTVTSLLFVNPLSFSELFLLPMRLWSLLMTALGLKKRRRPWGTVYDSTTKQPLDPAYVVLRNSEGKDIATTLTDLDGRFGFVIPEPGNYVLIAQKTNYQFPSQRLVGYDHDELYRDLYFGEHFTAATAGEVIVRNIPMDPEKFDWNEFAKKEQHLMKFYSKRNKLLFRLSDIFFWIGFTVATVAVLAAPKIYNIGIFVLYVVLFIVRKRGLRARPFGYILDAATKNPIPFAIIRISYKETGVELIHRITDITGKYYCLLQNGSYVVRVDRKMPDGTYQTIAHDLPATVKDGYLAETFTV